MQDELGEQLLEWLKGDARLIRNAPPIGVTRLVSDGPSTVDGPTHHNPLLELAWVEQGRMEVRSGRQRVEASAGTCLLIPTTLEHTPRFHSALVHMVRFSPQRLADAAEQLERPSPLALEPRVFGSEQRLSRLARCLAEQFTLGLDIDDPEVSASSDALTYCLVRGPPPSREHAPDPSIRRALELMASSFGEPLSVEELARAAGLPRFVFLRRFRAKVGTSPYRALTELRLERAAERLRTSRDSILEVCLSCGFGDPGRFARMFRQRYGCTPRRFRAEQNPAAHETPIRRTTR
ncbi:helix-turn-helix domain-containing protein [Cystobacter fuscus]|nr:helix-turn-helix domain-containing protein [Cystobacter fuscus]